MRRSPLRSTPCRDAGARTAGRQPTWTRGAAAGVGLGLAQDLVGDGGDVALAEEDEAGQVLEGVALGPAEVGVGAAAGPLADGEEDGGDGVGDGGGLDLEDPEAVDLLAVDADAAGELGGVADGDLEEEDGVAEGECGRPRAPRAP
jgi:hypothetical protein